jgi:TP901 family phage tail tape measure protein
VAIRGSEIVLILRAKNQASMTIRRVARDVQFLGRTIKQNDPGFQALTAGRRAARVGAGMTHVGGAATLAGGGALLGLGGAARGFAEFDKLATQASTQIGDINTSVDQIAANADRLRNAILEQMKVFPATAEDMSEAAYDIYSSMDINFNKGIGLLRLFNNVAVAGLTDVETATEGAVTVLNNFGNPNGPIANSRALMDDMFTIIRYGRIDLATFNTMMNQIAPAAAAADQSLENVGGAIATLTRRLSPGIASAGLARLFEIFQRKDFQEGMRKAGVTITDAQGQLRPLEDILARIVALGPKPGKSLQNFIQTMTAFGAGEGKGVQATVQARRALVELVKHYQEYVDLQNKTETTQGQFGKQAAANLKSLGMRWDIFVNNVRRVVLEIGQDAIPVFERIGEIIGPLIDKWDSLDSNTKAWIVTTLGMVATVTLILGLFTSFVGVLTGFSGILISVAAVIYGRMIPAMKAWGQVMMMPGGPQYAMKSMLKTMGTMAAMGAIAVGFTLAFKGEGWQSVLGQVLLGAGVGWQFGGPVGAVLGAIVVPVVYQFMNRDDTSPEDELISKLKKRPIAELEEMLRMPENKEVQQFIRTAIEAKRAINRAPTAPIVSERGHPSSRLHKETVNELFQNAKTIEQVNKMVEAQLEAGNKSLKEWREERANILKQATDEQQQIISTAVDKLSQTYDQFKQMNEQAMGELFQGPWLTSETFNLAEEWGITPGIEDLNRDLFEQVQSFNKWQQSLRAIGGRGVPRELLQSLEALGPDAVDKLEVLRKASPKMFANFVRLWQQRQNAIKRETKIDFKAQLAQWNQYGKDIAFEIISGLRGENVTLEQGFERYILGNFKGALDNIKTEALAEFYKENPEARVAERNAAAQAAATRRAAAKRKHDLLVEKGDTFHIYQRPGETDAAFAKRIAWEQQHRGGRSKKKVQPKTRPPKTVVGSGSKPGGCGFG